ncbi:MAG: NUMOD3 domain-containing DNA-binding protein, partial [Nanoarchaeota archaeon]
LKGYREGIPKSNDHKRKIGEANKITRLGKKQSKQTKEKLSKISIDRWKNPQHRIKVQETKLRNKEIIRESHLRKWRNPSYKIQQIQKILNGLLKRPTQFEKRFSEICIENNLPFVYVGNGKFLINYKNPDFIDKNNKICVEIYFSYYKIRDYGSIENYKKFCEEKYHPLGWKVIFLDENDIWFPKNWKEICLNKINIMEVR